MFFVIGIYLRSRRGQLNGSHRSRDFMSGGRLRHTGSRPIRDTKAPMAFVPVSTATIDVYPFSPCSRVN